MLDVYKDVAASLYMKPCPEKELADRDFLKKISLESVQRIVMFLEKEAIYYRGEIMYIRKKWARTHLKEYELDL